ncbi:MAG: 4'-phosphopantetheinyl transferase superfamily protein [Oscillospiraceae bacterium]|jgi:phosphopantetheinyl transferase|nr:4'-phosphopantetheinyl transferase superfamily protein [Oscillospiraceae bacterium]
MVYVLNVEREPAGKPPGKLLARYALSELLKVPPDSLAFIYGSRGKPLLRDYPDVHFNVSHSGRLAVCAVSSAPVGIDVEAVPAPGRDFMKIAGRFFAGEELSYIKARSSQSERAAAFAEIWTKKEAYIKRDGRGLALPLGSFSVLGLPDVMFHNINVGENAACHICTDIISPPEIKRLILDGPADIITAIHEKHTTDTVL